MYLAHPFLAQPPEDARLWRYMTPTVFLSTLLRRSLHFAALDTFEDPFEGVPPPAVLEAARSRGQPAARQRLDAWKTMIERVRATICASCWHLNAEESEAMWKLYDENLLRWATTKRPSYRHESEFRLLARRDAAASDASPEARAPDAGGMAVPIDPEVLIEAVVLSPRMEGWQVEMFRGLIERLGFARPVSESSLLTSPF